MMIEVSGSSSNVASLRRSVVPNILRAAGIAAAAVVISISISSCAPQSGSPRPAAASALSEAIVLPPTLDIARFTEVAACMNAAGFQYQQPNIMPAASDQANLMGVQGLFDDPAEAAKSGYGSSIKEDSGGDQVAAEAAMDPATRAKYDVALSGPKDGETVKVVNLDGAELEMSSAGCFGSATKDVYGSIENYLELSSLYNDSRSPLRDLDVGGLQTVTDAYGVYGTCMGEKGYDFSGIKGTQDYAIAQFGESRAFGTAPSAAESALATADATCQQEAKIRQVNNDAYLTASKDWIDSHESQLLRLVDLKNVALANAKKILEGS